MIRVLLADDLELELGAIRYLLEQTSDIHIVSEASNSAQAVSKYVAERPDVSILDVKMPGMSNCEMLRTILSINPEARIILLTMSADPLSAVLAFQAGATGCISRHDTVFDLYDAVRSVALGMRFLPHKCRTATVDPLAGIGGLSNREEQILSMVATGRTQSEIARELQIDLRTVGTYLSRAANKLGLGSNVEVCFHAARNNRFFASSAGASRSVRRDRQAETRLDGTT
jgi:DNA-binding NarL/FixJ family response regulator